MLQTQRNADDDDCDYDISSIWECVAENWMYLCGEVSIREIINSYVENDQHPLHPSFGKDIEPDDPRYIEPPDNWREDTNDWYPANIEIDYEIVEDVVRRCEQKMNGPIGDELRKELLHSKVYPC